MVRVKIFFVCSDCVNGDVRFAIDGTPMIHWNNVWLPICGDGFWNNQYGATKFCQKLGYNSGTLTATKTKLPSAGFFVGTCLQNDNWDTKCTGGYNLYRISCKQGHTAGLTIKCSGLPFNALDSKSSCTGNND